MTADPTNIFGTDGIRDRGGHGWLAPEGLARIGRAIVAFAGRHGRPDPTVLIGRDPRESGPGIQAQLTASLVGHGATVRSAGILPTPAVSGLVVDGIADIGVVVSASHNPPEFNGVKLFGPDGAKLTVEEEERITRDVLDGPVEGLAAATDDPADESALLDRYLELLLASYGETPFLEGMSIVLDCARGATAVCAADAFRRAGATVHAIHDTPDGSRINVRCGSTHPDDCADAVRERGAHLGIAFDGDGDRSILIDEHGELVDGDEMMTLWALDLKARGKLGDPRIAVTVMSNAGMESYLAEAGIGLVRTQVGDREVHAAMREQGLVLGGEQSGHIIEGDAATGDGIRTGLALARLVHDSGRPLSELRAPIPRYPQTLLGVEVVERPPLEGLPEVVAAVDAAEEALRGHGRVLLRYSGTEPLARVLVEGRDAAENAEWAERIAASLRAHPRLRGDRDAG